MRYIIWHAPRSGSNLLCNLLHKAGNAGIADYENAGFFVGFPSKDNPLHDPAKQFDEYFQRQRTPNGVEGTKASFEYFDDIIPQIGIQPILKLLGTVDKHIYLRREDKVAQSVSLIAAHATKHYTSIAAEQRAAVEPIPDYNYDHIAYYIGKLRAYEVRFEQWFETQGIRPYNITYEDIAASPTFEVTTLMHWLGIDTMHIELLIPDLKKQRDPIKNQFIERYKREER